MSPLETLLVVYCLLVVASSILGGRLPALMRMTHLRTQLLMSFVAGLMLGIAMMHLWPHAVSLIAPARAGGAALAGVLGMFVLLRVFHAHAHFVPEDDETLGTAPTSDDGSHHDHHHDATHAACTHGHSANGKALGWMGMLFGLGLHTLIDGVALAASVAAESQHGSSLGLVGLGTFLAVALHKPLDAFAITSVMRKGGWSSLQQNLVNAAFSLACPLGALLFYFGAASVSATDTVLGYGLALSAGFFVCIALADLLPEVAFHDHDRGKLTASLLIGVLLAIAIENLPGHSHGDAHEHDHESQVEAIHHDGGAHEHENDHEH